MTKELFREHHLIEIMAGYEKQNLPLDLYISKYFRLHKAIGSKDRGYIAEALYGMIRWKGLIDHIANGRLDLSRRLKIFQDLNPESLLQDDSTPLHIKVSFPEILFQAIAKSHGPEKALELCFDSNFPAPTTIRANVLKISRDDLLNRWKGQFEISPCLQSNCGIIFHKKINFFALPEFQQGLFEVQDEGSQLLAALIEASPGQQILDYCSGSGGKTLAFAPHMENRGQIFLHDIRSHILIECKRRLKRAGIQNAQVVTYDDKRLQRLKRKMDWVLADVPCSGTGTLRRNPDMKWKFEAETVPRLVGQQRQIFEKALSYVKPGGKIVYSTCSILHEENQGQVDHFLSTYDLEVFKEPFQSLPVKGGMDGFFGVVLIRRN
jgi:16S rRNA C967 or C1407 C5-methylase (RsmB/RsmF family)